MFSSKIQKSSKIWTDMEGIKKYLFELTHPLKLMHPLFFDKYLKFWK